MLKTSSTSSSDKKGLYIKRILAVVLVITLVCVNVLALQKVLIRKRSAELYNDFFQTQSELDVMFFGSSHVNCGVSPMQLWRDYGITSYNFGNDAMGIKEAYWTLRLALDYKTPKVVVLDCMAVGSEYGTGPEEKGIGLIHDAFDCFPISSTKVEAAKDLFVTFSNRAEFLFPFSVYHSRWSEVSAEDFLGSYEHLNLDKGAEITNGHEFFEQRSEGFGAEEIDTSEGLPGGAVYLKKFIELCNEKNIPVVLTYIPFQADPHRAGEAELAGQIADEYGVTYFNMLNADIIDPRTDMLEISHVIASGAKLKTD